MTEQGRDKDKPAERGAPLLEWMSGAAGLLLFVAALVIVLAEAGTSREPAMVSARVVETMEQDDVRLARVRIENSGGEAAAHVRVGLKAAGAADTETGVEIDFLPPGGWREATVALDATVGDSRPAVRVLSYENR